MDYRIVKRGENPLFSVVIVDSRSNEHYEWVKKSIDSVLDQSLENLELIIIDNRKREFSIGKAYNEGMRHASGKWVYYLGDDDYISPCYLTSLQLFAEKFIQENDVIVTTYITFFDSEFNMAENKERTPMGAFKRSYFLDKPFNEELERYVDIDMYKRVKEDNKGMAICPYQYGYFYRQHTNNISGRKIIKTNNNIEYDVNELKKDFYIIDKQGSFTNEIKEHYDAVRTVKFLPEFARESKIIWSEWADENGLKASFWTGKQKKILRIHRYEVYKSLITKFNFKNFDKIIVTSEHIRRFLFQKVGYLDNTVVISSGVDTDKFNFENKTENNKIAYVGYLSRKKGLDLILLYARHFDNYEFHLKGKFSEEDFEEWFLAKKPSNVFIEDWSDNRDDIVEFFKDKTYVISPAVAESEHKGLQEGMACGLKPLIFDWIGSDEKYKKEWLFRDLYELAELLEQPINPIEYRDFIIQNYDLRNTFKQIEEILSGKEVLK